VVFGLLGLHFQKDSIRLSYRGVCRTPGIDATDDGRVRRRPPIITNLTT
jgi:hypothetical protein